MALFFRKAGNLRVTNGMNKVDMVGDPSWGWTYKFRLLKRKYFFIKRVVNRYYAKR